MKRIIALLLRLQREMNAFCNRNLGKSNNYWCSCSECVNKRTGRRILFTEFAEICQNFGVDVVKFNLEFQKQHKRMLMAFFDIKKPGYSSLKLLETWNNCKKNEDIITNCFKEFQVNIDTAYKYLQEQIIRDDFTGETEDMEFFLKLFIKSEEFPLESPP